MKKIFYKLFSTSAAGLYMILFAAAIGIATFVENDFGTSAAQKIIFKSTWFEILLVLFGITILTNIARYQMIRQRKWSTLTFHAAIVIILIGAGITRYFSFEGAMHIREDDTSNVFTSSETYLLFGAQQNGQLFKFDEKVYFASLGRNTFNKTYQIGPDVFKVELENFIPNPQNVLEPDPNGAPIIKLVIAGNSGREEYYLTQNDTRNIKGTWFNFGNPERPDGINIYYRNDSLVFKAPGVLTQRVMATQTLDTIYPGSYHTLRLRSLYSGGSVNFVIGDFNPAAHLAMKAGARKMGKESVAALQLKVTSGSDVQSVYVYGNKGDEGEPQIVSFGNTKLSIAYGSKQIQLPFSIKLRDFILDRYPGTNSASSYASEVTLMDPANQVKRDQRIYMNNILNYRGYRFFQSSFDQDELGTVLSVNHDFWGTKVSYTGYILLTIGLLLTLLSPKSRFRELSKRLKGLRLSEQQTASRSLAVLIMISTSIGIRAEEVNEYKTHIIPKEHAAAFGRLLVQDEKGRTKPMNTLSSEVLRKVARKESINGLTPEQVFLGMTFYPEEWSQVPMIKIGSQAEIQKIFNTTSQFLSFNDFFSANGQYILKDQARRAFSLQAGERNAQDKEIMKIDERVNICNMIYNGSMARIFPNPNDPSKQWQTPADAVQMASESAEAGFVPTFFSKYSAAVQQAEESQQWAQADSMLFALREYQQQVGGKELISEQKVDLEILLNKMNVFSRLSKVYGILGVLFLLMFFARIFWPRFDLKSTTNIAFYLLAACFAAHVLGLAIRWYISGRAPWSNGYESLIYIGFTTVLAGLIFSRKSLGGLTATAILASTVLMVSGLSWLDPEITPLVPVLKSYWLTIHVSMEAGSYGFLMLGAIIGLLNLSLMIFLNKSNQEKIFRNIKELTYVSEMTLYGGLVMVSIGTYLGGVWANESWGRYWGWDAKETWALVTTLVYAFILHMRFIPGLRGIFAFNLASLFGFASVMMTYFGVNYYLSGLHSYAAGDPVPIPPSVYYTAAVFCSISLLGYWKYRKVKSTAST
jgi:cytochrome c-type biogenesis protein CcsB